jgi:hypothetical protein
VRPSRRSMAELHDGMTVLDLGSGAGDAADVMSSPPPGNWLMNVQSTVGSAAVSRKASRGRRVDAAS